jgi:2-haloacid dehalogenase
MLWQMWSLVTTSPLGSSHGWFGGVLVGTHRPHKPGGNGQRAFTLCSFASHASCPSATIGLVATTLVFDVNETMLDLADLDQHFTRVFDNAAVRREWFSLVLRNALTLTVIGDYSDFAAVAGTSLDMVAEVHGVAIGDEDRSAITGQMTALRPHPDVPASLARLKESGLRLVALTNSPPDIANRQLNNSGLAPHFDHVLSVHSVGRFKPHPEVYLHAAAFVGESPEEMMMVAAHDWDIAGAMAVGMKGAYVLRPGMARNALFAEPTIVRKTMTETAQAILDLA